MESKLGDIVALLRRGFFDKRAFNFFLFFITIAVLMGVLVIVVNPDFKSLINDVPTANVGEKRPTGMKLVLEYIVNNGLKVPIGMTILALVPVGFLYMLQPTITTGLLGGLIMGVAVNIHSQTAISLAISALPHTVSEMYAYAVWASSLFTLNTWIRDKMLRIVRQETITEILIGLLTNYILIVVPLIIIGALLETYVADWILKLFP